MAIITSKTHASDTDAAAAELAAQLRVGDPRLALVFASPRHSPARLAAALASELGEVPVIGCTTAGELLDDAMLHGSAVAMGLDGDLVAGVRTVLVRDPGDPQAVQAAVAELARGFGSTPGELEVERFVGVALHDGLSVAEERVMDAIGTVTNVPFIGGSAGDDRQFERTHVFADGEAASGASLLALIELRAPYAILKTQSFDVLAPQLEVTDADEATRTVHAFDGQPAAQAYAAALGCTVAELPDKFGAHPLGLVIGGEPFVRSPQQVKGDDVVFYCQIKPGMKLRLLRTRDIVADTRRDLQAKLDAIGGCRAVVNFHCILRTIELEQAGQTDAYAQVFAGTPTIGFSTYGESYIGHINQTSTMLLLGAGRR